MTSTTSRHTSQLVSSALANLPAWSVRSLAILAVVTFVVARGLAPALPGSRSGIDAIIRVTERWIAAGLSQLLLFAGAMVAVRLVLATMRRSDLNLAYRGAAMVLSSGVLLLVMYAAGGQLRPEMSLLLGAFATVLALSAIPVSLSSTRTRVAGLVLTAVGASALTHLVARWIAVRAGQEASVAAFQWARAVATLAFTLDVVAVLLVALWLMMPIGKRSVALAVGALLLVALVVWGAGAGSTPDASLWQVLCSRALAAMDLHPTPLPPKSVRYALEVAVIVVATASALAFRRSAPLQACLALALLTRGRTDIPLSALSLALAALFTPFAQSAVPGASSTSREQPPQIRKVGEVS